MLHVVPATALDTRAAFLLALPAAVLAPRPGEVTVGVTRALLLPVPARAPLLVRLGVVSCEAVFQSSFAVQMANSRVPLRRRDDRPQLQNPPCCTKCLFSLLVTRATNIECKV